ncbi:MAG: M48 family metallopeptidase [Chitinophagales bacterium]
MLYSVEEIYIQNVAFQVKTYLKDTRNHNYRIRGNNIGITIPAFYKSKVEIEKFKSEWIGYAATRIQSEPRLLIRKPISDRKFITVLGIDYTIEYLDDISRPKYTPHSKKIQFPMNYDSPKIKTYLNSFIQKNFQMAIEQRVSYINQITVQKTLNSISIKSHKSRWGSCSSKGDVTISINTLLAPRWVLDYVIVHELCHRVYMDHSPKFWTEVSRYFPKYALAKKLLKDKGAEFSL